VRGLIPGIAPAQAVALTALLVLALDGAAAGTKVASLLPVHVPTGAGLAPRIEAPLPTARWAWLMRRRRLLMRRLVVTTATVLLWERRP
jgi:hypothetical protein